MALVTRADLLTFLDLLIGKIWKQDGTQLRLHFLYKVLNNVAAPTLKDSFIDRIISQNNYNLRNTQTDLLKEAFNIAALTFGITFRWKLSKLIQSPF